MGGKSRLWRATLGAWLAMGGAACRDADPPPFDSQLAWEVMETQVKMGPRYPGSPSHETTRAYLVDLFRRYSSAVTVEEFSHPDSLGQPLSLANILVAFSPPQPERILVAAHWDTRPIADQDPDPARRHQPIPGANDGASGVAVLAGIASALHQRPPGLGMDLVLFDGEDYGRGDAEMYLGSRYFATQHSDYRPRFGILLDMVGDRELKLLQEGYSSDCCPRVVEKVWRTAARLGWGDVFIPRVGYYISDDHLPLIRAGMPVIDLIDFDYPYWHTTGDDLEKVSRASLKIVGEVVLKVIYQERP